MTTSDNYKRSLNAVGELVGNVKVAHVGEWNKIKRVKNSLTNKQVREEFEHKVLNSGATLSINSKGRLRPEVENSVLTCFEVDRDRVLRSSTFRRLSGKCQVFINPTDDMLRTRLTHTLEVEQIATVVSNALGLNTDLARAIALAHDCGHGPGGHTSEEAFSPFISEGFDHAIWGADVTLSPLNLTLETLDGVRNHSWRLKPPSTPEASVVSWADRIAYVTHDWADAVRVGFVDKGDLPKNIQEHIGSTQEAQSMFFITKLITSSRENGAICMDRDSASLLNEFRDSNFNVIYSNEITSKANKSFIKLLTSLVEYYIVNPQETMGENCDKVYNAVQYVASMTDRYAINTGKDVLGFRWNVSY